MPSVQVIGSAITIKTNTLMSGFSVHSGLPLFSAALSFSTDRKDEFISLLSKEEGFLGV